MSDRICGFRKSDLHRKPHSLGQILCPYAFHCIFHKQLCIFCTAATRSIRHVSSQTWHCLTASVDSKSQIYMGSHVIMTKILCPYLYLPLYLPGTNSVFSARPPLDLLYTYVSSQMWWPYLTASVDSESQIYSGSHIIRTDIGRIFWGYKLG